MSRRSGECKLVSKGKYRIRIVVGTAGGRRRTYSETIHATKEAAEKRLRELLVQRDAGTLLSPITMSVAEWLNEWLRTKVEPNKKQRTTDGYREMAHRYIVPHLGEIGVSELTRDDVVGWVNTLKAKGLSPRSIKHAFSVIHNAFTQLVRDGKLGTHPCKDIERPAVERAKVASLTVEQAQTLLRALPDEPLGALWALLLTAALRPSEALALRWCDIEGGQINVRRAVSWTSKGVVIQSPKTKQGYRHIPLDPLATELLKARWDKSEHRQPEDLIFSTDGITPMNQKVLARRQFKTLLKRHGLPQIRLYDLRHTGTTLLLAAQVPLTVLKERLGHKDAAFLIDTYAHVLPNQQNAATAALAKLLGTGSSEEQP